MLISRNKLKNDTKYEQWPSKVSIDNQQHSPPIPVQTSMLEGSTNVLAELVIRGCSFITSYYFGPFWTPPSLSICVITLLPPFDSPHVRHDRLTYYFIKLITINTLFHTIIFGHHFKGVEELLNSLEW